MEMRNVSIKEIYACPLVRLDAKHYIPIHRTWECEHGSKLRTRGSLVKDG